MRGTPLGSFRDNGKENGNCHNYRGYIRGSYSFNSFTSNSSTSQVRGGGESGSPGSLKFLPSGFRILEDWHEGFVVNEAEATMMYNYLYSSLYAIIL